MGLHALAVRLVGGRVDLVDKVAVRPLDVAAVADGEPDGAAVVKLVLVHRVRSLVGMHVAADDEVHSVQVEQVLIDGAEALRVLPNESECSQVMGERADVWRAGHGGVCRCWSRER